MAGVIDILTNQTPELAPYSIDNISGDLTGWDKTKTWIQVSREGGLRVWPKISKPRIDIDVYAPTSNECADIMDIVEASIFRAQYQYRGWGIRLHRVIEEVGPVEAYDKHEESPRYFCSLRLTTTPDFESMP
ncbi:hypothetical protein [Micromonospora sp. CB01531]|uniref:hypothetical protein n=1 Tax=Micromonospora sp. CB01531 TaxID=1718947 RepID=UPI0011612CD3|nr:hypothetical protein [Micromonospora sp. CB01531]